MNIYDTRSETAEVINQSKQLQERSQSLRAEYQALVVALSSPCRKARERASA